MTIREKLTRWMEETRTGQKAVAEACGMAQSTVSLFLSGQTANPSHEFLLGMARMLGTSLEWLLDADSGWPVPRAEERGVLLPEADREVLNLARLVDRHFGPGASVRRLLGETYAPQHGIIVGGGADPSLVGGGAEIGVGPENRRAVAEAREGAAASRRKTATRPADG